MRTIRTQQFDQDQPPWLYVVSRCSRGARIAGEPVAHRRSWIIERLQQLAGAFAVDIGAFAILDTRLDLVLRPQPQQALQWPRTAVIEAWRDTSIAVAIGGRQDSDLPPPSASDEDVAAWRERLGSLPWFMRALKEPISRRANQEDQTTGPFWQSRFKSVPLLDTSGCLSALVHVELGPLRAGQCDQAISPGRTSLALRQADGDWLLPLPAITGDDQLDGLSQEDFTALVRATAEALAADRPTAELAERLATFQLEPERWLACMRQQDALSGTAVGTADSLEQEAHRRGRHWIQQRNRLLRQPEAD